MRLRVGDISDEVGYDVLRYLIAGSGIDNVNVDKWTDENKFDLNNLFKKWRGNRTQGQMFDFVFDKNGYNCTEMFSECYEGSVTLDCCRIFEPTFVMMRGRCFRLVDDYYQRDVDETFKLSLFFKKIQGTLLGNNTRPQLIVHISDSYPEVGLYPRLYLSFNDWNRLHFSQRKIVMLPEHNSCSVDPRDQGKSTCFVYSWMNRVFVDSLNCTSPPFKAMLPYLATVPTCEPEIIVQNYKNVTSTVGDDYGCLPACQRTENRWRLTSSMDLSPVRQHAFRVEASFSELEYEEYTEIRLTTGVQLLSELGGQIGLFLGTSVMTFVQILLGISVLLYRKAKKVYIEDVNIALTLRP
ncbi:unnamed protein product [Cylicocyclus nassatus]|uniref:Uncharacterized protein n=1 Tax=Cylicocyclus nassatus TaxID=53992 RepID=A0AA36M876_CYLNA|nr:unnamed protein product [Cylicocyclus nassatus]